MQSAFRFLVVIVLAVFLNHAFASADANQAPLAGRGIVACNLIETCSHVSAAIENLETKLENLIALVNKTYPLQPAPSRKSVILIIWSILVFKHSFVSILTSVLNLQLSLLHLATKYFKSKGQSLGHREVHLEEKINIEINVKLSWHDSNPYRIILEIVFTGAGPAFDNLFMGCVFKTNKAVEQLTFQAFYSCK